MADLVFAINRTTATVRRETWDGGDGIARDWLVAPVVGLVPGVLNGELVTREAVKPSEKSWENVPLVIEHPKRGEKFISAQENGVQHVGMLRRPHVNGKLQGEMWFDVSALSSTGPDGEKVIAALEAGEMLEVSTAYFRSVEERAGAFNGKPFQTVAHDIAPDHLAVLLSGLGSCSIDDGCGVPRVNQMGQARRPAFQGTETGSWEAVDKSLGAYMRGYTRHTGAEMDEMPSNVGDMPAAMKRWIASKSLLGDPDAEDFRELLFFPVVNPGTNRLNRGALVAVLGGRAAQANIPQAAIDSAQAVARRLLEAEYPKANEGESMDEKKLTVKSALRAIAGAFGITEAVIPPDKEADMDKEKIIRQLVANGCPLDESALSALEDDKLQILAEKFAPEPEEPAEEQPAANEKKEPVEPVETGGKKPVVVSPSPDVVALVAAVKALDEKVETLITNQKATADAEKSRLVDELVANNAPLPKAALEKLDLGELQTLAQSLIPADYSLQALGRTGGSGEWLSWEEYVAKQAPAPADDGGK